MSVPYLTIESDGGDIYNFSSAFWLYSMPYAKTVNVKNKAFANGGRNVSDNYLQARTITIEGALRADTLALLETAERAFHKAILKGGKLTVSDDTVSRYIYVKYASVDYSYIGDYKLEKPVTITFTATDPFWRDSSETTDTQILSGDGTFTVDNSGSDDILFPTIEIIANQAVDVPTVFLRNQTDGNMVFKYVNADFISGATLTINCEEGTVKLNNSDSIEYVTEARFLRLQPETNTIEYEGAACTINVKFRKVYL